MTDPSELPLRDIHLPAEPGWWPPAPGWWLLLLILVTGIALVCWWRWRQRRLKRSAIYMAQAELDRLQVEFDQHRDSRRFVADVSILLRRMSISILPRADSASLTGEDWLSFLDLPFDDHPFSNGPGRILLDAPYRPQSESAELEPFVELCRRWLNQLVNARDELKT